MFKIEKRETVRAEKAAQCSHRVLLARATAGLRDASALVCRHAGMLTAKKRSAHLRIQREIAVFFGEAARVGFDEHRLEREVMSELRRRDRDEFETLCDASIAF